MSRGQSSTTATIGLHGSASTWVFNIVRELLIAAEGKNQVLAIYAEKLFELPATKLCAGQHLVIKSHYGSFGLDRWLQKASANIVLSLRDPRDAVTSMISRFQLPVEGMIEWLESDCRRLMRLAAKGYPLLRYEDRFFEGKQTIDYLAEYLELKLPPPEVGLIFARYQTASVQAFSESFNNFPSNRIVRTTADSWDMVTQIHAKHIGDTQSGKWRALPSATQEAMTERFKPFLERFGYLD